MVAEAPLGYGLIGAGAVSRQHAAAATRVLGLELRAVADIVLPRAETLTAEYGGTPYADYRQLLQRDDIDLVCISLPHALHCEASIRASLAGKHVLVEKPMALCLEDCDRMIAAARQAGRLLCVGQVHHFHPLPRAAKSLLDSGRLGRIVMATETFFSQRRLGYASPWFFEDSAGGGQLMSNGVNFIDRLMWTIGSPVVCVKGMVGTYFNDYPVDDGALAYFGFANGVGATLALTGHYDGAPAYEAYYVCTKGMVRYGAGGLWISVPDEERFAEITVGPASGFARQLAALAEAIRNGGPAPVAGEWGRAVMAALLALRESSHTGREVFLDSL